MNCDALKELDRHIHRVISNLSASSRTAKLWLQFQQYIANVNYFTSCERLKYWQGHLTSCASFLNLFAATGHVHYAKSLRLYLQNMLTLADKHQELYKMYSELGMHSVQRSGHVFNGLSTDLVIEQVLMRSLKSRGGLTHGRGMTESVRLQWVHSMHHFLALHNAMKSLSGKQHSTPEDHIDCSTASRSRDTEDLNKIIDWLNTNNPYSNDTEDLKSLSTGLIATQDINCDESEQIGYELQCELDISFADAKIKRTAKVKSLIHLQPGIVLEQQTVHIEPEILMLMCLEIAKRYNEEIESYFEYELSALPASLFQDGFMRHANKSDLANKVLTNASEISSNSVETTQIVIDG